MRQMSEHVPDHDVSHESIKGRDPTLLLTAPEDLAAVDVEGGR